MKKTTLLTAVMAVAFGLSACTNAEMAAIDEGVREGSQPGYGQSTNNNQESMVEAQRSCKTYTSGKTDLPMAAVSAYSGYRSGNTITIPMRVKWDDPFVDERGECKVVDGRAVSYRITD